jgi:predicted DNA-binding protein
MNPNKQKDFVKTAIRLPPEVHKKLHAEAEASGRTFNAEMVGRLSMSLEKKENDFAIFLERLEAFDDRMTAAISDIQNKLADGGVR